MLSVTWGSVTVPIKSFPAFSAADPLSDTTRMGADRRSLRAQRHPPGRSRDAGVVRYTHPRSQCTYAHPCALLAPCPYPARNAAVGVRHPSALRGQLLSTFRTRLSFEIKPSLTLSCASAPPGVPNRSPATACCLGSARTPPTSPCASGTATGVAACWRPPAIRRRRPRGTKDWNELLQHARIP